MAKNKNQEEKKKPAEAEPEAVEPAPAESSETTPAMVASQPSDIPSFVVGIGASAGGLEALSEFLRQMPANSGMAFIVVMHLDPSHKSMLDRLLQRYTSMTVRRIEDGMKVEPNQVYIIPPDQDLGVLQGVLHLMKMPPHNERQQMAIDNFFRHLAQDQGPRAICIILSGSGTDGTLGLRSIKEKGGLVVVQEPETAGYRGMPRSAIETGLADYILPPAKIPEALLAYGQEANFAEEEIKLDRKVLEALNKIFLLLRSETGQDFSYYRVNTLFRRITKRMAVHKIEEMDQYISFLRQNPSELNRLFYEILIGVTQFFREPEAFEVFKEKALTQLFEGRTEEQPLRVWVPGCSAGEEAYSLAMLIHGYKQEVLPALKVDIFATDINPQAIEKGRFGQYPASIMADVPEDYLKRYFLKRDQAYQIKPEIREMLIFAEQSLLKDPPFSKLDLISCRNLLIYLKPEAQKKVLSLFQYALKPGGFLFLGSSENIGDFSNIFIPLDRKWRLFKRTPVQTAPPAEVDFFTLSPPTGGISPKDLSKGRVTLDQRQLTERMLLEHYNPVGILINEKQEILYTYGQVDLYLKIVPGEARLNVLDMARTGLEMELAVALRQMPNQTEAITRRGLWVKSNGGEKIIDLIVKPIQASLQKGLSLIIINETAIPQLDTKQSPVSLSQELGGSQVQQLEKELEATRQHLQNMIEELQVANEEHRSFAEELQSANEELQSTNEELTTSQEELQSVNEELVTANTEVQNKNVELRRTNNDLHNLLSGTDIATIFLDTQLNIKRFTPAATKIINFITTDLGRPLKHIVSNLNYESLIEDLERVLDTLNTQEQEVQTQDGRWYNMRLLPYRTVENVIEGVVLTFSEITPQKKVEEELRRLNKELRATRDYARTIIDTLHEGVLILDQELRVISGNHPFYQGFQIKAEEIEGKPIYALKQIGWDLPQLRERLEEVISQNQPLEQYELEYKLPRRGRRKLRLSARPMPLSSSDGAEKILLTVKDITDGSR